MSGEKGSRCESCTSSSPYFASRGMIHWETGKETDALESNPEAMSRETCLSQYRNVTFVPKSVLARVLSDCRDNLRNSRSVFLIV